MMSLSSWSLIGRMFLLSCVMTGVLQARSILNFPFLTFDPDTITGVAIVNLGSEDAVVTVTAYGTDGLPLQGNGIENPVPLQVAAGTQSGTITESLFGTTGGFGSAAWFQAVSETDGLTGFFLHLDRSSSFLDGADLPPLSSKLVFSDIRIGPGSRTELSLINPSAFEASLSLSLYSQGDALIEQMNLPARGAVRLDVAEYFSQEAAPSGLPPGGPFHVVATADQELVGFAFVQPGTDLLGLNARPAKELLNSLVFPQLAVLGIFETELMVVNEGEEAVILTVTAYRPDGTPFGPGELQTNPVIRVLNAGFELRESLEQMFGFEGEATFDGWLQVDATSQAIQGAISYSIPSLGSIAAVAGSPSGSKSAVFSHIATDFGFFTGVAILNSAKLAADVDVSAVKQDGTLLGQYHTSLSPGQRISKTLTEMISAAEGQSGGFILVKSNIPVFLTSVFGHLESRVLSNVPAQPAPRGFSPSGAASGIRVSPSLAIVPVSGKQQFSVQGSQGAAVWRVNGDTGGGAAQGTISGSGLYTAPAQRPSGLPVVVTATVGEETAGASTDVLSRTVLAGNLGIVQSVAYLSGLARVYTAELSVGATPAGAKTPSGLAQDSNVFDVTTGSPSLVTAFPGEDIPKMIPYRHSSGKEFLLLAARTTGRILRLDPESHQVATIVTGLDEPVALVIDPLNGDLLVAESEQVTRVTASLLNQGLTGKSSPSGKQILGQVVAGAGPAGLAVDTCSGDIYFSEPATGQVRRVARLGGETSTLVQGLDDPGHLLGLYRAGVSCPDSFHLLVVEKGAEQVTLVTADQEAVVWGASPGVRDLARQNPEEGAGIAGPSTTDPGILLAGVSGEVGRVELVPLDLYEEASNPPPGADLLFGILGNSANVRLLETPPAAVGSEALTSPDEVFVFLERSLTLEQELVPDLGTPIAAGTRIRSYFFHYDPPGAAGTLGQGFVRFDREIFGIINQTATLDSTDAPLGSPTTDYEGTQSRVWAPSDQDSVEVLNDPTRVDFSAMAQAGQDQLRVLVLDTSTAGGVPSTFGPYEATYIGQGFPSSGFFDYSDMNNLGEVVFATLSGNGYIWLPAPNYGLPAGLSVIPLEAPAGTPVFFYPMAINDAGQVVGFSAEGIGLWQNRALESLKSAFGDADPVPTSINNAGDITGSASLPSESQDFAFLLSGQSFLQLGSPVAGAVDSAGFGLNNLGQVAGGSFETGGDEPGTPAGTANEVYYAIVWPSGAGSGQVIADNSIAFDINDSGQVIYSTFETVPQSFLWESGGVTPLGSLGSSSAQAFAINNLGHVVGSSVNSEFSQRAFVWHQGTMLDLNEQLVNDPGVILTRAIAIADSGFVLCQAGSDLYLLRPVSP